MSSLCGCYYEGTHGKPFPLISSEIHSTILETTFRTVLKQSFISPVSRPIKECQYQFPLYDGVSVVKFVCKIGEKTIHGVVKEKLKAQKTFDEAVAKGKTASLLAQRPDASDVFTASLGNIPRNAIVSIEITYVGGLKHDAEADGIRFTIPTAIAPRYGEQIISNTTSAIIAALSHFDITVDVTMTGQITGIQSPSHPINVTLGATSTDTSATPSTKRASVTLAQKVKSSSLDTDFVLVILAKEIGIPKAIVETHSTIPNHRAMMLSLVPKFQLPPSSQAEIVYVIDRSGSMDGKIAALVSAMKVFLRSMPTNPSPKFNICSFGSKYSFLWKKSTSYCKESLDMALKHVELFNSDFGGTETLKAIRATIENRFKDLPLEIIVLTDGDIWRQEDLFDYVSSQVKESNGQIRVFPLGIGAAVSSSLIQGLARAGNGFAHHIQGNERFDKSVVRMLKQALSPHVTDYTLEVKYENTDEEDFEIVERVTDGMRDVLLSDGSEAISDVSSGTTTAQISLFDQNCDPDAEVKPSDPKASLPNLAFPKLLQAPHKIPSLFPFQRLNAYLLMSPSTAQRIPTAVILRATLQSTQLHLEIPVEMIKEPGDTIHQLASRKATQDLEEGRGWIYDATDDKNTLIKNKFDSQFQDLVKREAVRLGKQFQVVNKWCSTVAVEENQEPCEADYEEEESEPTKSFMFPTGSIPAYGSRPSALGGNAFMSNASTTSPFMSNASTTSSFMSNESMSSASMSSPFMSSPRMLTSGRGDTALMGSFSVLGGGRGGSAVGNRAKAYMGSEPAFKKKKSNHANIMFSQLEVTPTTEIEEDDDESDDDCGFGGTFDSGPSGPSYHRPSISEKPLAHDEKVHAIIDLQDFAGFWDADAKEKLEKIMGLEMSIVAGTGVTEKDMKEWITLFVVLWLEGKMGDEREVWEMVVEKARDWVLSSVESESAVKELEERVSKCIS